MFCPTRPGTRSRLPLRRENSLYRAARAQSWNTWPPMALPMLNGPGYVLGCCAYVSHSIVMKLGTLTKSIMAYLAMTSPGPSAHAQYLFYVFGYCGETKYSIVMKLGTLTNSMMRYSTMTSPSQSAHAQWTFYIFGYCGEMTHSIVMKLGTLTKSTMRYSAMTSPSQSAHAQCTLYVFCFFVQKFAMASR